MEKWFVLQVNQMAEKKPLKNVIENITKTLKCSDSFPGPLKISLASLSKKYDLLDGYIFVKTSENIINNKLKNIEDSEFVDKVLKQHSKFCILSEEEIKSWKNKLSESLDDSFKEGNIVKVTNGLYKSLLGEILMSLENNFCVIKIDLHSTSMIVKIPFINIEKVLNGSRKDNYYLYQDNIEEIEYGDTAVCEY